MRAETAVSPVPAGAGRFRDVVWPGADDLDSIPTSQGFCRISGQKTTGAGNLQGGGFQLGAATPAATDWVSLPSNGAGGTTAFRMDNFMNLHIWTARNSIPVACNDEACYRIIFIGAVSAAPNAGKDMGMYLSVGDNGFEPLTGTSGFGFRFADANTVNFLAQGPNGLQETVCQLGDVTQFHAYEMRLTSATATADASIQVRIDNVVISTLPVAWTSWAAGTNLPSMGSHGGRCGWKPLLVNFDTKVNFLEVVKVHMMSGPTMADCL